MMFLRFKHLVSFVVVVACCVLAPINAGLLEEDAEFYNFHNTLSNYIYQPTDLIFVIDESGSVSLPNFGKEILFTEMVGRMFNIAPDQTRVAVITFSSGYIVRYNYLTNGEGTACNFMSDLANVDYKGGWTHTRAALEASGNLFASTQRNVNKVIVLISDGYSNNGDPIPVAINLRRKGIIIFAVGVGDFLRDELFAISSSADHLYLVSDFEKIENFNENLRKDVVNDLSVPVATSYCSGIAHCQANAVCTCERTGTYKCGCQAGYYLDRLKRVCRACSVGTYQSSLGRDTCVPCPRNTNTTVAGATSLAACRCNEGFHGSLNQGGCISIKCPKLLNVLNGEISPPNCDNHVYAKCSFWCRDLYCPYNGNVPNCVEWSRKPTGERTCQVNGRWSNEEFRCDYVKCQKPNNPHHGRYHCDKPNYEFKSSCRLECEKGYTPIGKAVQCLRNGSWSGVWGHCEIVHCQPLTPRLKVIMKPESCALDVPLPYQTKCQMSCVEGYEFVRRPASTNVAHISPGQRVCGEMRLWYGSGEKFTCKDIVPPVIHCPPSIEDINKPSSKMSKPIKWVLPTATDNDAKNPKVLPAPEHRVKGKKIPKPPSSFPIGIHKLTYVTKDYEGLTASCSFKITIKDVEAPVIVSCPPDKEVRNRRKIKVPVNWGEPRFKDNCGEPVDIFYKSHLPNDEFEPGFPQKIVYKARDPSGNVANCTFLIKMKPYTCPYQRPPLNGFVTCVNSEKGELCTISCMDGHGPVRNAKASYMCEVNGDVGTWKDAQLDDENFWPDCGVLTAPNATSASVQLQYQGNVCNIEVDVQGLLAQRLESLFQQLNGTNAALNKLCNNDANCILKNVRIDCNGRRKRQVAVDNAKWSLRFELEVSGNNQTSEDVNSILNNELSRLLEQLSLGNLTGANKDVPLQLVAVEPPAVQLKVVCGRGQQVLQNNCVNCPPGSFLNSSSSRCDICVTGMYQPNERLSSCLFCPIGSTTLKRGSISEEDCLKPCKPGTYSSTGLEQCLACDIGFYQSLSMQTSCLPCSDATTTWMEGSTKETDCQAPCVAGRASPTGLTPCYPCPRGSYQEFPRKTECVPCSNNLTTAQEGQVSDESCKDINYCDANPCHNGSCKADHEGNIECICNEGFIGDYCENKINNCGKDFCFNNGTCIDGIDDFTCVCKEGFAGGLCETNIDECYEGACLNGGTCRDDINAYQCICPDGVAGDHCEIVLKNCDSLPCHNDGRCFDTNNGFYCCCPPGFTARTCEDAIDMCASDPCVNGASCANHGSNYTCSCVDGFDGANCELEVDDCASDPCMNRATCIDLVNEFKCACAPGYTGHRCESELSMDIDLVFDTISDINHVRIPYNTDMTSVTVSFWMQAWPNNQVRGTPVSFAYYSPITSQPVTNALTWYDFSKFIIHLHDHDFQTSISGTSDREWHHYALTWDSADGSWAAFQDGEKKGSGIGVNIGQPLWRGSIVLGQDQDAIDSGFTAMESFQGKLSQFNVWNFAMSETQIKHLAQTCGYVGNVFDWFRVGDFLVGNVKVERTDLCVGNRARGNCQMDKFCHGPNFDDYFCEKNIPSCSPLFCQNNGTCKQTGNYQICECTAGTTGRFCQYDINECAFTNGNCSHTCVNTFGSFTCGCPDQFYLQSDSRTCATSVQCTHDDHMYQDGEQWEQNCSICSCVKGEVQCHPKPCPGNIHCGQNNHFALVPGECCSRCVPSEGTCTIQPSNQYQTFDGAQFTFTSFCEYVLAQDCSSGTFGVSIENDSKSVKKKKLVITIKCAIVEVMTNGRVRVNGILVTPPYKAADFTVTRDKYLPHHSMNTVRAASNTFFRVSITTKEEVIITWSNVHEVSIRVPKTYEKTLCGLCGNFNGFQLDDFQTKSYLPADSLTDFALSWRVTRKDSCTKPNYSHLLTPVRTDPKKKCPEKELPPGGNYSSLEDLCKPLRMHPFTSCYDHVSIREYYELCLMDACLCKAGNTCHCIAILTYIRKCNKHRVIITDWKDQQTCANYCTGGQIFDDCGPPCPSTCSRQEEQDHRCNFQGCRTGCHCPSSLVLHEGQCIDPVQCPKQP